MEPPSVLLPIFLSASPSVPLRVGRSSAATNLPTMCCRFRIACTTAAAQNFLFSIWPQTKIAQT